MNVILYMAMSANGMIAKADDDTSWISPTEWNSYSEAVRKAGCVIVGHRTYDILTKQPEFAEFENVTVVVVTRHAMQTLKPNHLVAATPAEALKHLAAFDTVIVAGGSVLNAAFLKERLIHEMYLDIEPIVLGKGIPIFADGDFVANLTLLETKQLSSNEIQLHYKVVQ